MLELSSVWTLQFTQNGTLHEMDLVADTMQDAKDVFEEAFENATVHSITFTGSVCL